MRTSLDVATALIDAHVGALGAEDVRLADAVGRTLAADAVAALDVPARDQSAIDGLAVRADTTEGASAYNPLPFRLVSAGGPLPPDAGVMLAPGDPLPPGCDAVVPLAVIEAQSPGSIAVIEGVPFGYGVRRAASHCRNGAVLLQQGRTLMPHGVGMLAAASVTGLRVVRRPVVSCLLLGLAGLDVNGPMLRALIERDGGILAGPAHHARELPALRATLRDLAADLCLIVGGTGPGANDITTAAVAATGELIFHGLAMQPGETAGFGRTAAGVPVCLLPGTPIDCLWAYELLTGRIIRRFGGRDPELPFERCQAMTTRKIVSAIGVTEVIPIRCAGGGQVEPIATFADAGLAAAAFADGFVLVDEGSEGFGPGATVEAYLVGSNGPGRLPQQSGKVT